MWLFIAGIVAHAVEVVIHTRKHHAAGRGAGCRGVVVRESDASSSERVENRCGDLQAVGTAIRIAGVVE